MKNSLELIDCVVDKKEFERHLLFHGHPAYGVVFMKDERNKDRIRACINRAEYVDSLQEKPYYVAIATCEFKRDGSMNIYLQTDEDYDVDFPSLKHWEEFNLVVRHVFSMVETKFNEAK